VPVEVEPVVRRAISSYIETNGTLEAENEVDLVARTSGPITELLTEENRRVAKGQVLARLDDDEIRARLDIAKVELDEAELTYERTKKLADAKLVSAEEFEQAAARLESARAQYSGAEIELAYTEIRAPFSGLVVRRYIRFAEMVNANQPLFRLSDFDPLLCPIQVPERELPRLKVGQTAHITVEAWGEERFDAKVQRVSPVVDAETGTVRVTLEIQPGGKLRPGMFASVYLETERREDSLVIPRRALVLDSLGDTVYVAGDGVADRRDVVLGFREGEYVEVESGLQEGEPIVVIGQDGLADGTPIQIPVGDSAAPGGGAPPGGPEQAMAAEAGAASPRGDGEVGAPGARGGAGGGPPMGGEMTPERLEMIKSRMRERGMTDKQIEERLKQMKERIGDSG